MTDDPRCCGTGTCIINNEGLRWCGQKWNGGKMGFFSADKTHSEMPFESEISIPIE